MPDRRQFQNMQARRAQSQRDVARMMSQATMVNLPVVDRLGNALEVGDTVLYEPPVTPIFQVMAIQPIPGPTAPPGATQVVLMAQFPINLQAGRPVGNMVIIGHQAQAEPEKEDVGGPVDNAGPEPPAPAPGGDPEPVGATAGSDTDPSRVGD